MDRQGRGAAEIKAESLEVIARSHLDEARTWLLLNFVQTYVTLEAQEQAQFQMLLEKQGYTEAKTMQMTYEDRLKAQLTEQLIPQLTEQVTAQVTEQVKAQVTEQITARVTEQVTAQVTLGVKRDTLLQLLEEKFGPVPEKARRRIEATPSETALDQWLRQLVKAHSLAELGLE